MVDFSDDYMIIPCAYSLSAPSGKSDKPKNWVFDFSSIIYYYSYYYVSSFILRYLKHPMIIKSGSC